MRVVKLYDLIIASPRKEWEKRSRRNTTKGSCSRRKSIEVEKCNSSQPTGEEYSQHNLANEPAQSSARFG